MEKAVHLTRGTKQLKKLELGQQVQIQDQNKASKTFKQWTKTGVVVNVGDYDDYQISVDGSRSITKRNRQYLKPITPVSDVWSPPSPQSPEGEVASRKPKGGSHGSLPLAPPPQATAPPSSLSTPHSVPEQ